MKKALFLIALLGWTASVIVHILSIAGEDLLTTYPVVMALHVGVFIVWLPTVWYLKNDADYKQFQEARILKRSNPIAAFKVLLKKAPMFLKVIAIAGLLYAPVNFMIPFIEPIDEPNSTRMFSGHWMAFYGIALGALYPFNRAVVL
jgi:hypothetical protein